MSQCFWILAAFFFGMAVKTSNTVSLRECMRDVELLRQMANWLSRANQLTPAEPRVSHPSLNS